MDMALRRACCSRWKADNAAASVSAVRITVTGTNGIANAVVNEVRLYDHDGTQPFPAKKGGGRGLSMMAE